MFLSNSIIVLSYLGRRYRRLVLVGRGVTLLHPVITIRRGLRCTRPFSKLDLIFWYLFDFSGKWKINDVCPLKIGKNKICCWVVLKTHRVFPPYKWVFTQKPVYCLSIKERLIWISWKNFITAFMGAQYSSSTYVSLAASHKWEYCVN